MAPGGTTTEHRARELIGLVFICFYCEASMSFVVSAVW